MGVFAHDDRPVGIGIVVHLDDPLDSRIHRPENVDRRVRLGGVVVDQPRRLVRPQPRGTLLVARPEARLVAQRPDDDRRVVLVAVDHRHHALEHGVVPVRVLGELVPLGVRLDVGLVVEVDAVLVAEVDPGRVVEVVGRAHSVEVVLLHDLQVGDHRLAGHRAPRLRVELVAVDALEQDRLTVDEQLAVAQFDLAEADARALQVEDRAVGVEKLDCDLVEVWRLGRPEPRRANRQRQVQVRACAHGHRLRLGRRGADHGGAIIDRDARMHVRRLRAVIAGGDGGQQVGVAVVVVQLRVEPVVADGHAREGGQADVAVDAREAPEVLVLEVARIAPAPHATDQQIRPGPQMLGQVELGRTHAVLAVADLVAVEPELQQRLHALEEDRNAPAGPLRGHLEGRAIVADRVVARNLRRRALAERVLNVGVDRRLIALRQPVAGHRDRRPGAVVIGRQEGVARRAVEIRRPTEAPLAIEAEHGRRAVGPLQPRAQGDVRGFLVGAQLARVFPKVQRWRHAWLSSIRGRGRRLAQPRDADQMLP